MTLDHSALRWIATALLVLLLTSSAAAEAEISKGRPAGIDVILLLDSSPSTRSTDPEGHRLTAARFLLDYLYATSELLGVNHRAGFANFGGKVGTAEPLRLVTGEGLRNVFRQEVLPFTDFRPALQFALREFGQDGLGLQRQQIVVLFTDGAPHLPSGVLEGEELRRYFGNSSGTDEAGEASVGMFVDELKEQGGDLFVIAVGDSREAAEGWKTLVPDSHYIELGTTSQLADAYHRIFSSRLGFAFIERHTLGSEKATIPLRRLVTGATFSFIKEHPGIEVRLTDSEGRPAKLIAGGGPEEFHEVYRVSRSPSETAWIAEASGSAQVLVAQRQPKLTLDNGSRPHPSGQPLSLRFSLEDEGNPIISGNLRFAARLTGPDGNDYGEEQLLEQDEGRFVFTSAQPVGPGDYTLHLHSMLDGERVPGIAGKVPVQVEAVPRIKEVVVSNPTDEENTWNVEVVVENSPSLFGYRPPRVSFPHSGQPSKLIELTRVRAAKGDRDEGLQVISFAGKVPVPGAEEDRTLQAVFSGTTNAGLSYMSTVSKDIRRVNRETMSGPGARIRDAIFLILAVVASVLIIQKSREALDPLMVATRSWADKGPNPRMIRRIQDIISGRERLIEREQFDHPMLKKFFARVLATRRSLKHANSETARALLSSMLKCPRIAARRAGLFHLVNLLNDPDWNGVDADSIEMLFDCYREGAPVHLSKLLMRGE
jgi:hypothetical protein